MNRQEFTNLIRVTFKKWQSHDASLRAAAITFFAIMPLPSLALITVAVLAQVYGQQQALQQLIFQIRNVAGPSIADLVSQLLRNAQNPLTSFFGSLFAVVFALAGALGAFSVLQKSINKVWEIKPVQLSFAESIRAKFTPFILTGIVGFVVVAWTAFSTVLFSAAVLILNPIFGGFAPVFLRALQIILSFGLGTLLFAIIFKQLPEIHVEWKDVILAAVITSVIFTLLNYLFGVYLTLFPLTTLGGTAGSLILLFLWIYLVSLFILFGAQLTRVYAATFGSKPVKTLQQEKEDKQKEERVERVEINAELEWKLSPNN
jgi:membrane protein